MLDYLVQLLVVEISFFRIKGYVYLVKNEADLLGSHSNVWFKALSNCVCSLKNRIWFKALSTNKNSHFRGLQNVTTFV